MTSIQVERIDIDMKVLEKFAQMTDMSVEQALKATAYQVEGLAKDRAPVDTGALKNSIHNWKRGEMEHAVGDGVEYGIFQELGTNKMSAHPFLIPALRKAVQQITDAVAKEFGKILK